MLNYCPNRRTVLKGVAVLGTTVLTSCTQTRFLPEGVDPTITGSINNSPRPKIGVDPNITTKAQMYREIQDGEHIIPAVPYDEMDYQYRRQRLPNTLGIPVQTILIDTNKKFAYYAFASDEVVRYGVGVGKEGFEWSGNAVIGHQKSLASMDTTQ